MKLSRLIERMDCRLVQGSADVEISDLVYDSRKVTKGSAFVCIAGAKSDGHRYIGDVCAKGAAAVFIEKGHMPENGIPDSVTVVESSDTRVALAYASAAWFGYPAEHIPVIGITGTKGKTTTTYMIKSILDNAGYRCGLIGTIEAIIGDKHIPSANTTPESYVVQRDLRGMIDAGMNCAVMEVSSQALKLNRTAGIPFEIGVFTNISPDHIGPNEHASFEEYMHCKGLLFRQCKVGVVNADDPHTKDVLKGHTCRVETYGIDNENADLRATDIQHEFKGGYLGVKFNLAGKLHFPVELTVPGKFSVYNALTAIAVCEHFKISEENIQKALLTAKAKGRIEPVKVSDKFTLLIDYAHNAMALTSLLTTLRDYKPHRIVCLFGCGGDRDPQRRFEMGEASGKLADFTIITSDNPRTEDPMKIIADIETGMKRTDGKYIKIPDRREAIRYAIQHGEPGDIIVLAGKGHEDYQEINGVKYPMDERVIISEILAENKTGA